MIQSFQVLTPTNCQGVIGCRGKKWAMQNLSNSFKGRKVFAGEEVLEMTKFFLKKRVVWSCIWESYLQ